MKNTEQIAEMRSKIINELTQIKKQNTSSAFVIDDLMKRIESVKMNRKAADEYCTLLMQGIMALGMMGGISSDGFNAIQNLNKECAELAQKK